MTHTVNANGLRRVYLGGKSSVESWIAPDADGVAWSFHIEMAPTSLPLPNDQLRAWAVHMLTALADDLAVAPDQLKAVPFERIAALHTSSPSDFRRVAAPKRQSVEHGYMATSPNIKRPQADFARADYEGFRRRG